MCKHGKIGHRYVMQYFHLEGLSPTNIKAKLHFTLGVSAPLYTTIKYWVAEFEQVVCRVLKMVYYVNKGKKIRVNYRFFLEPRFSWEFRRIYVFHESSMWVVQILRISVSIKFFYLSIMWFKVNSSTYKITIYNST